MNNLFDTLKSLGPARLAMLGGVGVGLILFFAVMVTRMSGSDMTTLYSDLGASDSSAIATRLDQLSIPYRLSADGSTIEVGADDAGRARMELAQDGLPRGSASGYELFDQSQGFGTTEFAQNVNQLRAIEGELARTIATLDHVRNARVHLVLPRRELFAREANAPSASIFITLDGGGGLAAEQIGAIRYLVSSGVPQLQPAQVSIIDQRGNLLARGDEDGSDSFQARTAEEMRRSYESRLTRAIEQIVGSSVGYDKVRAEVSADMDFDRITTNEESYDPAGQVIRSTQFVDEQSETVERDGDDDVGVQENLPEVQGLDAPAGDAPGSTTRTSREEETVNYEISRTVTNRTQEVGRVNRLSVAVLVDGQYAPGPDGQMQYQPLSEEQIQQINALARSAAGIDDGRGDTLEVVNMPFAIPDEETPTAEQPVLFGLTQQQIIQLVEIIVLGIVAILVVLLVVRPLLTRLLQSSPVSAADESDSLITDQSESRAMLQGPRSNVQETAQQQALDQEGEFEQLIDINQVEGRVRASSLRKVGEIVEKHPEEAVSILRNWMYQEA